MLVLNDQIVVRMADGSRVVRAQPTARNLQAGERMLVIAAKLPARHERHAMSIFVASEELRAWVVDGTTTPGAAASAIPTGRPRSLRPRVHSAASTRIAVATESRASECSGYLLLLLSRAVVEWSFA